MGDRPLDDRPTDSANRTVSAARCSESYRLDHGRRNHRDNATSRVDPRR